VCSCLLVRVEFDSFEMSSQIADRDTSCICFAGIRTMKDRRMAVSAMVMSPYVSHVAAYVNVLHLFQSVVSVFSDAIFLFRFDVFRHDSESGQLLLHYQGRLLQ
jgi:hypothetical protein